MFLVLDNTSTAYESIEECMSVSNSMTMADRTTYQNIYKTNKRNTIKKGSDGTADRLN